MRGGAPCSNRAQLSAPACAVPHAVVILTPVKRARHLVVAACRSRVRAIELWARTYGTLVARRRAAIACNHIVCLGTGGGAHFGRCEYGNESVPWKVGGIHTYHIHNHLSIEVCQNTKGRNTSSTHSTSHCLCLSLRSETDGCVRVRDTARSTMRLRILVFTCDTRRFSTLRKHDR